MLDVVKVNGIGIKASPKEKVVVFKEIVERVDVMDTRPHNVEWFKNCNQKREQNKHHCKIVVCL